MPISQAQIDALKAIDVQRATLINALVPDGGGAPPPPPTQYALADCYPFVANGAGQTPPAQPGATWGPDNPNLFAGGDRYSLMPYNSTLCLQDFDGKPGVTQGRAIFIRSADDGRIPKTLIGVFTQWPNALLGIVMPYAQLKAKVDAVIAAKAASTEPPPATIIGTPPPVPPPPGGNVALASVGAVASASSFISAQFPAPAVNDGDRKGLRWGAGGGWNSNKNPSVAAPDWLQINFSGSKNLVRVAVYTLQDEYQNPVEPTDTMTFGAFGIVDFTLQGWTGTAWQTLGTVAGNNLVKRTISFPAFATDRIRIAVTQALSGYSRIVEVEAYEA